MPVYEGKGYCASALSEPRKNYWTLPAGFMENGETTPEGAARETWEEAQGRVSNLELYRIFDVAPSARSICFYRCDLDGGQFGVDPESLESGCNQDEIPWDEIAFRSCTRP